MFGINKEKQFCENTYEMSDEPLLAALMTTGNGYMGVRASFEEFGAVRIQGAFVRGYIDEITEIIEPFADNQYMKKYYLNEPELKRFEKQESGINMPDFTSIKICIGKNTFYPWEGKILSWNRSLDPSTAIYTREVEWEDPDGNRTKILFERFASFSAEHCYYQMVKIVPLNHNLLVTVTSGVDTQIKTCGQHVTVPLTKLWKSPVILDFSFTSGSKYGFEATYRIENYFPAGARVCIYDDDEILGSRAELQDSAEYVFFKKTIIAVSCDGDIKAILDENAGGFDYCEAKNEHLTAYRKYFQTMDIIIEGDDEADAYLRFAGYHTAISAPINDSIHGAAAKGLTGERYNQFVWWDSEIYQLPFFNFSAPETAKNLLLYRYKRLSQSKKNAEEKGYKGAMFAFCSGVKGDELVWKYVRHPFMQVHINADVPYGIISYFDTTGDELFLKEKGFAIIYECLCYWRSRVTYINNRYEILEVTGPDEHHPYVDNDAYTNYLVHYIFDRFLNLIDIYDYVISNEEKKAFENIRDNLYLPIDNNDMIPQFDGYFSLNRGLEEAGNGAPAQFQMKTAGLYHKSQVIKQPDVMLLYSYMNFKLEKGYAKNWDYYEHLCESSSSLSYPVHAVASIENGRPLSFYKYFMQTIKIDVDDLHKVGWQGVHSGCLAGGYLSILRGVFGIRALPDALYICPNIMPFWKSIKMQCMYKNSIVGLSQTDGNTVIKLIKGKPVSIFTNDKKILLENEFVIKGEN